MSSPRIEPGLLRIFRWYVAIRLGLLLLVLWSNQENADPTNPRFPEPGIVMFGILLLLLVSPQAKRVLGRTYLPVALVIASIAPIIESAVNIEGRLEAGMTTNEALADFWMPFFLLFVPLLLIAWQYRYRAVLVFVIGTTLLDLAVTIPLVETQTTNVAELSALIVGRGLLFAFVGLFVVKLMAAQKEARRSLAAHSATLEHLATSRERNRLARELHDTLAHSLSGIAVQLEAVKSIWDDEPEQAAAMVNQALESARDGLGDARRAIQALRASSLEELGLEAALAQLGERTVERSGIAVDVTYADNVGDLDPDVENAVYRIADESLTNVARHSGAELATVDLRRRGGRIRLEVIDNGVGFDANGQAPDGHVGIKGMTERAEMVGGSVAVASRPGEGTTVTFEVAPWK
ncbi:MAG: sensor histidine kinase [Acidimicrobiia bacterium]|nr:sensor histidine kinase [Acidimicrobiia bacterium]